MELDVKVSGEESILKDVESDIKGIKNQAWYALTKVGSEMEHNLKKHIREDWYYAYTPSDYIRRTDDRKMAKNGGIPLGSGKTIDCSIDISKLSLSFDYRPTGGHKINAWSNPFALPDEIIERIQTGSLAGNAPPRPFWNNFVEEQKNGKIIKAFKSGMKPNYKVIEEGGSKDVYFDGRESLLDDEAFFTPNVSNQGNNVSEDDGLPY